MQTDDLYSQILDALRDRSAWEDRQRVFYEMRHQGLRRINKPFPGAADLHFPLADTIIEKLKPFYFAQLHSTDTFASLVCRRPGQEAALTAAAAQWLDYKLRLRSNFQTETLIAIDRMLATGAAPLKVYWDARRNQVRFAAPAVTQLIVPAWTQDLQDADWVVHVLPFSTAQYRANPLFHQDDAFVERIAGGAGGGNEGDAALRDERARREGITCGAGDGQIVLWEIYVRDHEAAAWKVLTRSPQAFGTPVRPDFGLPYRHGRLPFVLIQAEVNEQGCYSSRGVTEIVAPFEASASKLWNEKHDAMSFYNRPLYQADKDIPNVSSIQLRPGQILPFGLKAVEHPAPPMSFDEELSQVRGVAEYRMALPDFGVLQSGGGGSRTATEINQLAGQSSTVTDLRARVFRLMLAEVYAQAWALLVQYDGEDLGFTLGGVARALPPEALHGEYEAAPNGTDQSWNRAAQFQRAADRTKTFGGSPYVDQAELVKSALELDDPALVKRLFRPPSGNDQ